MPISVVFDPPLPSDSPSTFNTKAFTLLGDLNDWSTQANALPGEVATNLSALLASPPAIGGTTPAAGSFTTLSTTGNATLSATNPAVIFNTSNFQFYKLSNDLRVYTEGADRAIFNASGLAVTGALSSTTSNTISDGTINLRGIVTAGAGYFGTVSNHPLVFQTNNGERMRLDASGNLTLSAGTLGYGAGAGGTVTQATSKATTVTLNKPSGLITMDAAALASGASVQFVLSNSVIAYGDSIQVTTIDAGYGYHYSVNSYYCNVGQAHINVTNTSVASRSDALILTFSVLKGAIL